MRSWSLPYRKYIKNVLLIFPRLITGFWIALPYLRSREKYLISLFGTGDTFFICGLLPEYRKKYPGKFKVLANVKHKEIVRLFGDDSDFIYISPRQAAWSVHFFIVASYLLQRIVFCRPYRSLFWPDWNAAKLIEQNGILTMYKRQLNLDDDCLFHKPDNMEDGPVEGRPLKNLERLNKKRVILAPSANSFSSLNTRPMMEQLARELILKGYQVYTNGKEEEALPGTKALLLRYDDLIDLGNRETVTLVSVRSGLCDILSCSSLNLIIIYPSESYFSSYSLNRLFGEQQRYFELTLSPTGNNEQEVLASILERIEQEY